MFRRAEGPIVTCAGRRGGRRGRCRDASGTNRCACSWQTRATDDRPAGPSGKEAGHTGRGHQSGDRAHARCRQSEGRGPVGLVRPLGDHTRDAAEVQGCASYPRPGDRSGRRWPSSRWPRSSPPGRRPCWPNRGWTRPTSRRRSRPATRSRSRRRSARRRSRRSLTSACSRTLTGSFTDDIGNLQTPGRPKPFFDAVTAACRRAVRGHGLQDYPAQRRDRRRLRLPAVQRHERVGGELGRRHQRVDDPVDCARVATSPRRNSTRSSRRPARGTFNDPTVGEQPDCGWRAGPNVTHVLVVATDAAFHTPDGTHVNDSASTTAALQAQDILVIGLKAPGAGTELRHPCDQHGRVGAAAEQRPIHRPTSSRRIVGRVAGRHHPDG